MVLGLAALGIVVGVSTVCLKYMEQRRAYAERTSCVGNLVRINLAKSVCREYLGLADGDLVPDKALDQYLSGPVAQYRCPNGGPYLVGKVGEYPRCTYTNACYTYFFDRKNRRLLRLKWTHEFPGAPPSPESWR